MSNSSSFYTESLDCFTKLLGSVFYESLIQILVKNKLCKMFLKQEAMASEHF